MTARRSLAPCRSKETAYARSGAAEGGAGRGARTLPRQGFSITQNPPRSAAGRPLGLRSTCGRQHHAAEPPAPPPRDRWAAGCVGGAGRCVWLPADPSRCGRSGEVGSGKPILAGIHHLQLLLLGQPEGHVADAVDVPAIAGACRQDVGGGGGGGGGVSKNKHWGGGGRRHAPTHSPPVVAAVVPRKFCLHPGLGGRDIGAPGVGHARPWHSRERGDIELKQMQSAK